eukprot:COSAG04_NODE_216_length_19953_cov_85.343558_5_plen_235_part_00
MRRRGRAARARRCGTIGKPRGPALVPDDIMAANRCFVDFQRLRSTQLEQTCGRERGAVVGALGAQLRPKHGRPASRGLPRAARSPVAPPRPAAARRAPPPTAQRPCQRSRGATAAPAAGGAPAGGRAWRRPRAARRAVRDARQGGGSGRTPSARCNYSNIPFYSIFHFSMAIATNQASECRSSGLAWPWPATAGKRVPIVGLDFSSSGRLILLLASKRKTDFGRGQARAGSRQT